MQYLFFYLLISAFYQTAAAPIRSADRLPLLANESLLNLLPREVYAGDSQPAQPISRPDVSSYMMPGKNFVQFSPHGQISIRLDLVYVTGKLLDSIQLE